MIWPGLVSFDDHGNVCVVLLEMPPYGAVVIVCYCFVSSGVPGLVPACAASG